MDTGGEREAGRQRLSTEPAELLLARLRGLVRQACAAAFERQKRERLALSDAENIDIMVHDIEDIFRHALKLFILTFFMLFVVTPHQVESQALPGCTPNVVNYPVAYVRAPRYGDATNTHIPEVVHPLTPDPGAELRIVNPDCSDTLLFPTAADQGIVDAPIGYGAVLDPYVSFDGQWVAFAYFHDRVHVNDQRTGLSTLSADIYRVNVQTREVVRLTHSESTPNTGNGANFNCSQAFTNCPHVGVFNTGPAFVSGDLGTPRIVFTSSRNNFLPTKATTGDQRALQLFVMDFDGSNVHQIGFLNLATALHPFQLLDGRILFTSWENQGIRDQRLFNLWTINPDGTHWASMSGLGEDAISHHFATQVSNGDIVVVRYYNQNNNGFGDLVRFPVDPPGPDFLPVIADGTYMALQRPGQIDLTQWAMGAWSMDGDYPSPCGLGSPIYPPVACSGTRTGKTTQPAAAPNGDILLVYSHGPAHNGTPPYYDGGIYLMPGGSPTTPTGLRAILADPTFNELQPRPVVAYAAIFGVPQPSVLTDIQNDGSGGHGLPANSPFGVIGTSSLVWRDTNSRPPTFVTDPDVFNGQTNNWHTQGADAGVYSADDIYGVRILSLEPSTDRSYPGGSPRWNNAAFERLRILGEMPVRHEGVIDGNGNVDTSFLARVPADTPITFQTLDRNGMVLNMAQTWHQVRPGEARYDCGGCHAHSKNPLDFETTAANTIPPTDMTHPTTVEYLRDIQPILASRCAGCHNDDTTDGALNLHADGTSLSCNGPSVPGTYYRLAVDQYGYRGCPKFGLGTPAGTNSYFLPPNMSRYIRAFQSRQSLLVWKLFGARLDGRTNATRTGDIDYTADSLHPGLLTQDEKMAVARWIDLGTPINLGSPWGWFEDDLRPTLWVSPTEEQGGPVAALQVAAFDLESGLSGSLSVTSDVALGNVAAGTNLASSSIPNGGTVSVPLPADPSDVGATITVKVTDNAGQQTALSRKWKRRRTPTPQATPTSAPPTATPTLVIPTATPTPDLSCVPSNCTVVCQ